MQFALNLLAGTGLWIVVLRGWRFNWLSHFATRQRTLLLISMGILGTGYLLRDFGVYGSLSTAYHIGSGFMLIGSVFILIFTAFQAVKSRAKVNK